MMNISIKLWFVGGLVDCTRKTSSPRTFSSILTKVSPSGNGLIVDFPSSVPNDLQIESAKGRLEVPLNIFTKALFLVVTKPTEPVEEKSRSDSNTDHPPRKRNLPRNNFRQRNDER